MSEASPALEQLQFLLDNRFYLYNAAYAAVTIWAFWRGAAPERAVAAMLVTAYGTQLFLRKIIGLQPDVVDVDVAILLLDLGHAAAAIAIALYANRIYPLWIAGLQIIALQAHLAKAITPDIAPLAYAIMVIAPSYGQLITLALGMRAHRKRLARHGKYRSWRGSWRRLPGIKRAN